MIFMALRLIQGLFIYLRKLCQLGYMIIIKNDKISMHSFTYIKCYSYWKAFSKLWLPESLKAHSWFWDNFWLLEAL